MIPFDRPHNLLLVFQCTYIAISYRFLDVIAHLRVGLYISSRVFLRTLKIAVGKVDAGDCQRNAEVDRPPWICMKQGVRAAVAV